MSHQLNSEADTYADQYTLMLEHGTTQCERGRDDRGGLSRRSFRLGIGFCALEKV